jgi:hypothetical protein
MIESHAAIVVPLYLLLDEQHLPRDSVGTRTLSLKQDPSRHITGLLQVFRALSTPMHMRGTC